MGSGGRRPLPGVYFSQSRENSWGERRGRKAGGGKKEDKSWRKGKIRTKVTVLQLLHLKLQLFSKMEAPAFVWMAKFIYVTSLC